MVAEVNSAATLIASRYEAARSSRVRAPLLIHYHIFKNAGTSFKESVTQAPIEKALFYYDSFNPLGFVPAARSGEICKPSSGSRFLGTDYEPGKTSPAFAGPVSYLVGNFSSAV